MYIITILTTPELVRGVLSYNATVFLLTPHEGIDYKQFVIRMQNHNTMVVTHTDARVIRIHQQSPR